MFPTHVGMNRWRTDTFLSGANVPHTRGDEPFDIIGIEFTSECSPHTWG